MSMVKNTQGLRERENQKERESIQREEERHRNKEKGDRSGNFREKREKGVQMEGMKRVDNLKSQ